MRFLATNFCKTHGVDGVVRYTILNELQKVWPEVDVNEAEVVIFVATWRAEFVFDRELFETVKQRGLPIVVLDYFEHRHIRKYNIIGHSILPRLLGGDYEVMHKAMADANIVAYFKREYPTTVEPKVSYPLYPIDFTVSHHDAYSEPDTEEAYNNRPIDVCFIWGYSHESRPRVFTELLKARGQFGMPHLAITDTDVQWLLKHEKRCPLALLYQPFYNRLPLKRVFELQSLSKVTVSLFGAGNKCFRSAEGGYNSLVAHQAPELVHWAFPWQDGVNCIGLPNVPGSDEDIDAEKAVTVLLHWLRVVQGSLYPLYLRSVENTHRYHSDRYTVEYVVPKIEAALGRNPLQLDAGQETVNLNA